MSAAGPPDAGAGPRGRFTSSAPRKPTPDIPAAPARSLTLIDAAFLVTGSMVGAGIFLVSGVVARHVRSPAAVLALWLAGGVLALAGALCNGELGALLPRGGGEYVYLREAYGPALGFLSGWTSFWVGFPGSIATMASGLGRAVADLAGASTRRGEMAIGLIAIVGLTALNARGIRPGKRLQNTLVALQLASFAVLIAVGVVFGARGGGELKGSGLVAERPGELALALVSVFFAYSGWNAATYVAGEIRDASRNLGRALLAGTCLCMALYIALNVVYLRALPLTVMRASPNVAEATLRALVGSGPSRLIAVMVALSVLSSLQAAILTGPRIYQAMAADGVFFRPLATLHPRFRVPVSALAAQATVACALLLSGSFERLLTFTSFAIGLFSTLTVGALVVLRVRRPNAPRAFRTPLFPLTPALFITANGWVLLHIVASGVREAAFGLVVVAAGLPAYALFRRRVAPVSKTPS